MRRARKVKESAIIPYKRPTKFSKHICPAEEPSGVLEWAIKVLKLEYGLTRPSPMRTDETLQENLKGATYVSLLGDPFLFVLASARGCMPSAESCLRQLLLGQRIGSFGLATDGSDHVFLRRRHDSQRCDYLTDLERCRVAGPSGELTLLEAQTTDALRLTPRLEGIFFEAHSHIRDIDGMHQDEALDELCKVIFLKLHEEAVLAKGITATRLIRNRFACMEEFAACLRRIYFDAATAVENNAGAEIFSTSIRLSSPALCRVFEVIQDYSLSESESDIKGRAFQRVLDPAMRAGMGQFFTPLQVIDFMVECLRPQVHESVLDPFCGSGHFLSRTLRYVRDDNPQTAPNADDYARKRLAGIEKSDRMVRIAKTDMLLNGDGRATVLKADSLAPFENLPGLEPDHFDVVLTNPPFGSVLGSEALSQLGNFDLPRGSASVPLEVLGLERSVQFLKPGGRIGIVLPEGIFANSRQQHVRDWLLQRTDVLALVSLPIETFAPFGANVKTTILFARKRRLGEASGSSDVTMARVDAVGYDATGRSSGLNELPALVAELGNTLNLSGEA